MGLVLVLVVIFFPHPVIKKKISFSVEMTQLSACCIPVDVFEKLSNLEIFTES